MSNRDQLRQVDDIDGVLIHEWPNHPAAHRYTVLHAKCGVNIRPTDTIDTARGKARTHSRKCR